MDRALYRYQRRLGLRPIGLLRPASPGSFDLSGGVVGGTLGYNYQMGQAVFGIEGDIDWSNIRGSAALRGTTAIPATIGSAPCAAVSVMRPAISCLT